MKLESCALVLVAACAGSKAAPPPSNVAPPEPGPAPVALAIVFNGQELWAGNDQVETDPVASYQGALLDLERGIDRLNLPPSSSVTAIEYSNGAQVVVPWTPADRMHGSLLGDQHTYYRKLGDDLAKGVDLALDTLAKSKLDHKILLVVGDGADTDDDAAKSVLASDAQRATAGRVVVRAIVWKDPGTMADEIVHVLAPSPVIVNAASALPAAMAAAVQSAP
jgi:hypothetical protein